MRSTPRGCMLVHELFEHTFAQAQSRGEMAATRSPTELARYLHCVMSGLRTQTKCGLGRQELLGVIDMVMENLR